MGRDLEGSNRDIFEVLVRHFSGGTEDNYGKSQDSLCPVRGLNQAPLEYNPNAGTLNHPARSKRFYHLLFSILFQDSVSNSYYVASNEWMVLNHELQRMHKGTLMG
jgi:hypothetical protein